MYLDNLFNLWKRRGQGLQIYKDGFFHYLFLFLFLSLHTINVFCCFFFLLKTEIRSFTNNWWLGNSKEENQCKEMCFKHACCVLFSPCRCLILLILFLQELDVLQTHCWLFELNFASPYSIWYHFMIYFAYTYMILSCIFRNIYIYKTSLFMDQ